MNAVLKHLDKAGVLEETDLPYNIVEYVPVTEEDLSEGGFLQKFMPESESLDNLLMVSQVVFVSLNNFHNRLGPTFLNS